MKVSVLTPTCDRPVGFALCETMLATQTLQPDEWIVADGGQVPLSCTMGQLHIHDPAPPGAANFAHNLLRGIDAASGDVLIVCEDDDAYLPAHVATMVEMAERGYGLVGAEDIQRYYNVSHRCFRMLSNVGASLCQTAVHRSLFPAFRMAIQECLAKGSFGVDTTLWRAVARNEWGLAGRMTVVGIKGLPGCAGLGIGHRPDGRWTPDPELAQLREWLGDDAERYAGFRTQSR